ncbi:ABC transporter substrate-binding protein [Paracoccus zhejiangensis]|uniref:Branched-chain amino acid ABC transporter substrate-binding protein n=1 Tax=Paracoccus zhejiangensis TaxID=1077935 RepID=A0A2H5F0A0_9RHOB|nr:ABC transporter substrate-binding protein [Paracoccus zhejiangensis]AUH64978.1 branched-chain amino acid ABC transporter substrate-binding protein [Paracoccus zhejiangensis]
MTGPAQAARCDWRSLPIAALLVAVLATPALAQTAAKEPLPVPIGWLKVEQPAPPILSNLAPPPADTGLAGARLGREDNATTGSFMGHDYQLTETLVPEGEDALAAARSALAATPFLLVDAPAQTMIQIADLPEAQGALIFNIARGEDSLRGADCRRNLLHTAPSDSMLTDALMQFIAWRQWSDLVLIEGEHPGDAEFSAALEASATKFGQKIAARKTWAFDADMRRNASAEVPLFTQDFGDYDLLLLSDTLDDFDRYIPFNTWLPRPTGGTEGIVPAAWSPSVEQSGAAQLQSRFIDLNGREMQSADYAAWAAVRAVGEAVTRLNSSDPAALRDFLLSDQFQLAGFKGRPQSFRDWNGQMRQPIPLVSDRAVVALAPIEGFMHQVTELDTLGTDRAESACSAFSD